MVGDKEKKFYNLAIRAETRRFWLGLVLVLGVFSKHTLGQDVSDSPGNQSCLIIESSLSKLSFKVTYQSISLVF